MTPSQALCTKLYFLLGNGDGTFQPEDAIPRWDLPLGVWWRATSPATASSTWPSVASYDAFGNPVPDDDLLLLGNGDGTFQTPGNVVAGIGESTRGRRFHW